MRIHSFYLSYFLLIFSTSLSVDTFAQMFRVNTEHEDRDRHYLLYLPTGFTNQSSICLLYTSDAADEEDSVDLGGRRIIKKISGLWISSNKVIFFSKLVEVTRNLEL